jgi:signal transduction histidine kinase
MAQMNPLDFVPGLEKEYIAQRIQEVFENGESDAEANIVSKSGTLTPFYLTGKRIEIEGLSYLIGMGIDITRRKRAEEELAERVKQMRALASYVESVREDERTRMAREIHDEFGQFLTALKMDLAWVSRRLPEGDEKRERLNQASALVDENVRLVQRIATELRPGLLDDLGLITALDWQATEFSKHTGLLCQLNLPEQDLKLDPSLNTTLFRIFQETLTNVARHAQASSIDISLQVQDQTLGLIVRDNGRGITESQLIDPNSLGLLGLRERVTQWKGHLNIHGEVGKGTTVTVQIPIPPTLNGGAS